MGSRGSKVPKHSPAVFQQGSHGATHGSHRFIADKFSTFPELEQALRVAGLESCDLIMGIDLTRSNERQGYQYDNYGNVVKQFYANPNLHSISPYPNPYQHAMSIICRTLHSFDVDQLIPAYGFGDTRTGDHSVFSFLSNANGSEAACVKLEGVLNAYSAIIADIANGRIQMSGPTSFAPIIRKAIELVTVSRKYHILIIIADGVIDTKKNKEETIQAIVDASKHPLSIVCVGVGAGPFDLLEQFDDCVPERDFDNFQFVNFHQTMATCENQELGFATKAMMEIPEQWNYIKTHIL